MLVRERSPIADVVGEHIQLRNAGGGNLKGLCPFHDEKSPSFNVTPARGYYFCFGCGEGGDVITFVRRMEHLSFAEAIERLAQRAGIQLRYEQGGYVPGREQGERTRLIEAHRVTHVQMVPTMFVRTNGPESRMLRSTWLSAAKL